MRGSQWWSVDGLIHINKMRKLGNWERKSVSERYYLCYCICEGEGDRGLYFWVIQWGWVGPRTFPLVDNFAETSFTCMGRENCVYLLVKWTEGQPPMSRWMPAVWSGFPCRYGKHTGSLKQGGLLPLPVLEQDTEVKRKKSEAFWISHLGLEETLFCFPRASLACFLEARPVLEILINFPALDGLGHSSQHIVCAKLPLTGK